MEKTASELVRFALDEAGFAEDAFTQSAAAQQISGSFNRKPVNAALCVRKGMKKAAAEAGVAKTAGSASGGGGDMTPKDWQAHIDQHHKGKTPAPGHCKYLDDEGNPPTSSGATSKADAGRANETNVGTEEKDAPKQHEQQNQEQADAEGQTTEQQNANEVLNKMGASTQSPELQAAYQAAQAKLNQPTPMKVEGVEGLEGMTLYPTSPTEADICGRLVAAAKAGSQTAKLALQAIQKQGEAGEIKGEETPQEQQAEAPQVDPHEEWNKLLPTDPKDKLAAVEKEELERVQNLRTQMEQARSEGKDTSKFEQRIDECKQRVLEARAEAEGRNLEKEAAEKAEQEAEAAKPKEMTAEEYAAEAERYSPTTSKGMRELADKRYVDSMHMLEMQRKQSEDAGKVLKDYYERRDEIEARYKQDKENAEMVAAKESEDEKQQSEQVQENTREQTNAENDVDERGLENVQQSEGEGQVDKPTDAQTEGNTTENAEQSENEGETQEEVEPKEEEVNADPSSDTPQLYDFFQDIIEKNQDYITQEDADYLNEIGRMYYNEKDTSVRNTLITNYAMCVDAIVNRAKADRAQQAAIQQNKMKPAGMLGGIKKFFGNMFSKAKESPKQPIAEGLMTTSTGEVITKDYASSVGIAVGWDKAMRGIGLQKDAEGNLVEGGAKYLCRGPSSIQYQRLGRDSIIQMPESAGVQENIDVKKMELENRLSAFGINAKVKNVRVGSAQTTFELQADPGTNISNIARYKSSLMGALKSKTIGVQAPIPGTDLVGITVENQKNGMIPFSAGYDSPEWQAAIKDGKTKLPIMYGRDEFGRMVVKSLAKIGHMIVGGGTNSGKSSFMKTIEAGFMSSMTPNEVRFVHMNPVSGDVTPMSGSPYLAIPNASTPEECAFASEWLFKEMQNRIEVMNRDAGTADFDSYNKRVSPEKRLPYIVVFADEYGNQMSWRESSDNKIKACGKKIELNMTQMAARARHAGIHIIVGVQRPDVKSVNGTMKENMQGRVAFRMPSGTDYGTIMDKKDLRPLEESAQGTCYFRDGAGNIVSGQSAYADDDQIERLINDNLKQAGIV